MSRRKRRPVRGLAHVRLYAYELDCEAYRSLSPVARALLIEFRALFRGQENRVFMSIREMQRRTGACQRAVQRARCELIDRGWIVEIEKGSFHRKTKLATVYALTNEPLTAGDGASAPKTYLYWRPAQKKSVVESNAIGSRDRYREVRADDPAPRNGSRLDYCPRAT